MSSMLYLDKNLVEKHLDLDDLFNALKHAFANYSSGKSGGILQPVRTALPIEDRGFYCSMPAYSQKDDAMATKLLSFFPNNTEIETHQALIVLNDCNNGRVKAVMDGNAITDIRTAMASAVATKVIKNPSSAIKLAILGSGVQAAGHLKVFRKFFDISEARIWSRTYSKAEKFAEQHGAVPCRAAQEAVMDADVIITVTASRTPVLMDEWVKSGAHVNAVGACNEKSQEIDPNLMRRAKVFCDSRAAAVVEAGDIIHSKAEIYAEIGEMVNGTIPNVSSETTTVFKSLGMAIEDVVSAKLVYDGYVKKNDS